MERLHIAPLAVVSSFHLIDSTGNSLLCIFWETGQLLLSQTGQFKAPIHP